MASLLPEWGQYQSEARVILNNFPGLVLGVASRARALGLGFSDQELHFAVSVVSSAV
jgi:hypothetical protein